MSESMEAIVLTAPGSADHFRQVTLPVPAPRPDEVRIRVRAAGFNPMDFQKRKTATPSQLPLILGGEVAGVVDAVGEAVARFAVGDSVMALLVRKPGGYAEYVCVQEVFVAPKPPILSFAQAAVVPVAGLTAYEAVVTRAGVRPGDAVLITGASGGVGSMAVQLARIQGAARIVATAGSDQSARYLTEQLGIPPERIVRYSGLSRSEMAAAALECNRQEFFRVGLDFVGGPMTSLCSDVVGVDGHVVAIVSGPRDATHGEPENDEDRLFDKSVTFHFLVLSARAALGPPQSWGRYAQLLTTLAQLLEGGRLLPPQVRDVGRLSVGAVRAAHQLLEDGHVRGKLVMTLA